MMVIVILILMQIGASQGEDASSCSYPQRCGDIKNISYPFSLHQACGLPEFLLQCNESSEEKKYLYLSTSGNFSLQVLNIHSDSLIVNASTMQLNLDKVICNGSETFNKSVVLHKYPSPYVFSDRNTFITWDCGVGYYYTGIFFNTNDSKIRLKNELASMGGCISDCSNSQQPQPSESCAIAQKRGQISNYNCSLDISTPSRALSFQIYAVRYNTSNSDNNFNNYRPLCSAFAVAFFPECLDTYPDAFPLRIDWAIPYNKTREEDSIKNDSSFACSDHSNLTIVPSVPGYRCACPQGYHGDGYKNGTKCTDVNECEGDGLHKCAKHANCQNLYGNYTCFCKSGFIGDGLKEGSGCSLPKFVLPLTISIGAVLVMLAVGTISWYAWRQRSKFRHFVNNGGLQLLELLGGARANHAVKVFSIDELQEATNHFSPSNMLGAGGFGIVYKGVLYKDGGKVVAIKKAHHHSSPKQDCESFVNEMAILTQINHRHIVRLLGVCLETNTPLLVYEYVPHGTLAEHLHRHNNNAIAGINGEVGNVVDLPWIRRLDIAIQTGGALAYLHSAVSPSILHRDVKCANILLDENMDAKLADFGASRLIPDGQSYVLTAMQGTMGYMDPEYLQTVQLTEKSDVYSFGVVLAELLTGKKPLDNINRQGSDTNLASMFLSRVGEGRLGEIVDPIIRGETGLEEAISKMAHLTLKCLAISGEKRPSMREVVEELYHIKSRNEQVVLLQDQDEEREPLIQHFTIQDVDKAHSSSMSSVIVLDPVSVNAR